MSIAAASETAILELALRAMEDPDALQVLEDAVIETRWDDSPAREFFLRRVPSFTNNHYQQSLFARAVAAVLIFGGWPSSWALTRCGAVDEAWPDTPPCTLARGHDGGHESSRPTQDGASDYFSWPLEHDAGAAN